MSTVYTKFLSLSTYLKRIESAKSSEGLALLYSAEVAPLE